MHLYGPIRPSERDILLENLPAQYGIEECIFYHGVIDTQKLMREMQKYQLLIIPRPLTPQTHYGFSTKLSEYLVSGVPVLVTDVSDNALYIKDGVNGYIIPPGNPKLMAEKLLEIIENCQKHADAIAQNAYLTAKNSFDYRIYSQQLSDFMK